MEEKIIAAATNQNVVLCVSPCRSGSTAILRVVGAAGVDSYYQPMKTVLRWQSVGKPIHLKLDYKTNPIYIKETLGPYNKEECSLDPIKSLLENGIQPNNLILITLGRHPTKTWASWQKVWGSKANLGNLNLAYSNVEKIRLNANTLFIKNFVVTYEAFKEHRYQVFCKIFQALGSEPPINALDDWELLPPLHSLESNIRFQKEPEQYQVENLHSKVENSNEFVYQDTDSHTGALPKKLSEAYNIYSKWAKFCEIGLQTHPTEKANNAN